jgi:hypothetical protein
MKKPFTVNEQYTLDCFEKAFANATSIPYNPKWENGTGYFDNAVTGADAPMLLEGELVSARAIDDRDLIIIGTVFGNVVVFQRYGSRRDVFSFNAPGEIKNILQPFLTGKLSSSAMSSIVGENHGFSNIGERLRLSMKESNYHETI